MGRMSDRGPRGRHGSTLRGAGGRTLKGDAISTNLHALRPVTARGRPLVAVVSQIKLKCLIRTKGAGCALASQRSSSPHMACGA